MFKKRKLISILEVVYPSMNRHIDSYKKDVSEYALRCGYDEESLQSEYPEVLRKYRNRVLEDVINHYANIQSEIIDEASFVKKAKETMFLDDKEFSENYPSGYSPALIIMTFYYTLFGKRINYGEVRPLNVEEVSILDKALAELDAEADD